jgi:hypothetical protein
MQNQKKEEVKKDGTDKKTVVDIKEYNSRNILFY